MTARIKDSDIEHLSWIYDRLANVHLENTNFDYMHKLNAIIANLKLDYAYYGDLVLHREEVRPVGELIETPEEKEALDEKTYRYEKVEFDDKWKYFKLMHEEGDLYVNCVDLSFEGFFGDNINLANALHDESCIYRRIEVTERELFIDHMRGRYPEVCIGVFEYAYEKLKLVNGKG